jgi:hypothetical protein
MRKRLFYRAAGWLSINVAWMIFTGGCATEDEQSFNQNFNQNLPTSPKYIIKDVSEDRFKLELHQGSPDTGPERVTYLKQAATIVARDEARRRGWGDWQLDYIDERDQGWMHILVAEVKEKPAVQMTPPAGMPPLSQPPPPPLAEPAPPPPASP